MFFPLQIFPQLKKNQNKDELHHQFKDWNTPAARLAAIPIDDFGLLISPLLIIIFLVIDILFSVFFLKNAHYCKTKTKKPATTTLVVKKFFHPKKQTKKNLFIKAWDSRTHQNKKRPDRPSPPPYKTPFLQLCTLWWFSFFLIRTTKKQQKKKFLFSVLFILKKREKNLKEKKS